MQASAVAFILDIDGVLVRGHNALPCAVPALQAIEAAGVRAAAAVCASVSGIFSHPMPPGCPIVFVTNSTGYTEAQKAKAIAETLGCKVDAAKMIMAHSSMRSQLEPLQVARAVAVLLRTFCLNNTQFKTNMT